MFGGLIAKWPRYVRRGARLLRPCPGTPGAGKQAPYRENRRCFAIRPSKPVTMTCARVRQGVSRRDPRRTCCGRAIRVGSWIDRRQLPANRESCGSRPSQRAGPGRVHRHPAGRAVLATHAARIAATAALIWRPSSDSALLAAYACRSVVHAAARMTDRAIGRRSAPADAAIALRFSVSIRWDMGVQREVHVDDAEENAAIMRLATPV